MLNHKMTNDKRMGQSFTGLACYRFLSRCLFDMVTHVYMTYNFVTDASLSQEGRLSDVIPRLTTSCGTCDLVSHVSMS